MTLKAEAARALAVTWKDLTAERRARANLISVIFFAGTALLLVGFALGPDADALARAGAGVLWLTVLFSGILVFHRSYRLELEGGALEALLLYPGSRRSIFVGKVLANFLAVVAVLGVVLVGATVFLQIPALQPDPGFVAVLVLGTFGFVVLGTFYAAISSRVRARDVLLPLLLFPMLIPLLLGAVQGTQAFLDGDPMGYGSAWLRLLLAFDVIFLFAAIWAFDHIIED